MGDEFFRHLAYPAGRLYGIARFGYGSELPCAFEIERVVIDTSFEEERVEVSQVVLQTVVYARQYTRTQRHLEHVTLELHGRPHTQAARALEDLHRRLVAVNLYDLGHKTRPSDGDVTNLILRYGAVHLDSHKIGCDTRYLTGCFHISVFYF